MKTIAHHVRIARLGAMVAFFAASGCGILLGGYGDDPSSGGGEGGNGEGGTGGAGTGGVGNGGAGTGGAGNGGAGGSGDICSGTPLKILLNETELLLKGSTADKKSRIAPTISSLCAQTSSGVEDVFVLNIESDGILTVMTTAANTTFDSVLYARKDDCVSNVTEYCADRASAAHDLHGGELLSFPVKMGELWYIIVDGYNDAVDGKGDYELRVSLRTGKTRLSMVPVRLELGASMAFHGVVDSTDDVSAFTCGNLGEVIYKVEYGTGVQKIRFEAYPGSPTSLGLYGTKALPEGTVMTEGSCQAAGCGESTYLYTVLGVPYMIVDCNAPGPWCSNSTPGPYKLVVTPSPNP